MMAPPRPLDLQYIRSIRFSLSDELHKRSAALLFKPKRHAFLCSVFVAPPIAYMSYSRNDT